MEITILTGKDNFFGQTRKPWVGLNTNIFCKTLADNGIDSRLMEFHAVANSIEQIKDSIIFYTFSQKENLRAYINDVIYHLESCGNRIIPNYELLKCHENKGFQELYKKQLDIPTLKTYYFSNIHELEQYNLHYPIVIKKVDGSNGKGVYLCNSKEEVTNKLRPFMQRKLSDSVDLFRRRYLRKK